MTESHTGGARDTAAVTEHAQVAAKEVGTTVRDQAAGVAQEARQQTRQVAHDVRDRVAGEAEQQAQKAARQLERVADELSSMAESSGPDSLTSGMVRQAADTSRQAARFLDERGARGLLDSAGEFARRRPGTFLLGAAVAGFLVGRVAKSATGSNGTSGAPAQQMPAQQTSAPQTAAPYPAAPQTAVAEPGFAAPAPASRDPFLHESPGAVGVGGAPHVQR